MTPGPEEAQIIWPLVWVPIAALLSFLWSNGFFYRKISRKLYLRIDEGAMGPWWMGVCFPIYSATQTAYAIMPFNILLMWTWKALYWIRSKPVEFIWVEFGKMYKEVQDTKHDNKMLKMEVSQWRKRNQGIEAWKYKDAPWDLTEGLKEILDKAPGDKDWIGWVPKEYEVPLWMRQSEWSDAKIHEGVLGRIVVAPEPPWDQMTSDKP